MRDTKTAEKLREANKRLAQVEDDIRKATINLHEVREALSDCGREEPWLRAEPQSRLVH